MENDTTTAEATESPTPASTTAGDGDESRATESEPGEPEKVGAEGQPVGTEEQPQIPGEGGEEVGGEEVGGEWEYLEGEFIGEAVEGEERKRKQIKRRKKTKKEKKEELKGEGDLHGEHVEGEHLEGEQKETKDDEYVEEEGYVEELPPDPGAPFDFSESSEALKNPFTLREDQLAEIETLWELYQNYTPAYTDIDDYITEKELLYMIKSLNLYPYTDDQYQELIDWCIRPPHPKGHITFNQFKHMVTIRQRDLPIEDELRKALQTFDPENTSMIDRSYLKECLSTLGHKMGAKQLDYLIKEVDMTNDGTIGIEDVVGTLSIDLNREDIDMLKDQLFPSDRRHRDSAEDEY